MWHPLKLSLILPVALSSMVFAQNIDSLAPNALQSHFVFDHSTITTAGLVDIHGYPYFSFKGSDGSDRTGIDYRAGVQKVGEISQELFEFEQEKARSVLRVNFEYNKRVIIKNPDGSERPVINNYKGNGSAVVVGRNQVLTNRHVVDVQRTNKTPKTCPEGNLRTGFDDELKVQCKNIIMCGVEDEALSDQSGFISKNGDWCLLEVTPLSDGREIGDVVTPFELFEKISARKQSSKVASIGNPAGLGIQFSWGIVKNIKDVQDQFQRVQDREITSTAFAASGNSGGALINADGELIGIVYASSTQNIDSAAAIRVDYIVQELKAQLDSHQLALLDLKSHSLKTVDDEQTGAPKDKLSTKIKQKLSQLKKKLLRR